MMVKKVFFHKYESGKLMGFVDIQFSIYDGEEGLVTIKGWKVFRDDDGGGYSVQVPSTKKDGTAGPEYYPTILFSKDSVSEEFLKEINIRVSKIVERDASSSQTKSPKSSAPSKSQPKQANSYDDDELDPF